MPMMQATTLYCLVTEYASGGELLAYIKSQKDCRLGESASRPFIRQLLSAIFYLHERGIVHRYVVHSPGHNHRCKKTFFTFFYFGHVYTFFNVFYFVNVFYFKKNVGKIGV